MGAEEIKSACLYLCLYRPFFFSVAKPAVVTLHRKLWFASFFEHFEAVPLLLLVNCSLLLHPHFFEYLKITLRFAVVKVR